MKDRSNTAYLAGLAIGAVGTLALGVSMLAMDRADAAPSYPYVAAHCPGAVPGTDAGVTCEEHGWRVREHFTITPHYRLAWTDWPLCQTEDGTRCHWDADTQGNGHGRSFVRTRYHRTWYVR
jgi:hypothetical protein